MLMHGIAMNIAK